MMVGLAALLAGGAIGWFSREGEIAALRETYARRELEIQKNWEMRLAERPKDSNKLSATKVSASANTPAGTVNATPPPSAVGPGAGPRPAPVSPRAPAGGNASASAPVSLNTPEERARQHRRYDPFFRERGLTPEQQERLIDLLIMQSEVRADVQAAVDQQQVPVGSEVEEMRTRLSAPIIQETRQILGPDGYAAYGEYGKLSFYRLMLEPLAPQFAAAGAPLTEPQQLQLARILARNDHPEKVRATDLSSQARVDWSSAAREAAPLLSPAQIAVLQARALKN